MKFTSFDLRRLQIQRSLWLIALCAALAGLGAVAAPPAVTLALLGLGGWCALLVWNWRLTVITTLALSAAVPRWSTQLAGVTLNAERLAMPLCVAVVVAAWAAGRARLKLGWAHVGLIIYLASLGLASAVQAVDPTQSVRLTVLAAAATIPFWLMPTLVDSRSTWNFALSGIVVLGFIAAIVGVVTLMVYRASGLDLGIQVDSLTGSQGPFGTQWEGNTYGSYVAASLVLGLSLLTVVRRRGAFFYMAAFAAALIAVAALAMSLSRGAWLGAGTGLLTVLVFSPSRRHLAAYGAAITTALTAIAALVAPGLFAAALARLETLSPTNWGQLDTTTLERSVSTTRAIDHWLMSPMVGWGAGSYGQTYDYLSQGMVGWIGNLEAHIVHDSGLVGLLGMAIALCATLYAGILGVRRAANHEVQSQTAGLLGASVALLVAFQATEGTWLGFPWILFGLTWSAGPREPAATHNRSA
jgi:hypothetical protein